MMKELVYLAVIIMVLALCSLAYTAALGATGFFPLVFVIFLLLAVNLN